MSQYFSFDSRMAPVASVTFAAVISTVHRIGGLRHTLFPQRSDVFSLDCRVGSTPERLIGKAFASISSKIRI